MSLTGQLDDKNSLVHQFFVKYEDRVGTKECLSLLQSSKYLTLPLFKPSPPRPYYPYVGTTVDYLIRYISNNNHLDFEATIAGSMGVPIEEGQLESIQRICTQVEGSMGVPITDEDIIGARFCDYVLLEKIAKVYLDGRRVDELAVYSATALAMLDGLHRSGRLPKSFGQNMPEEKMFRIGRLPCGSNINEKTVMFLFDEYCFDALNWELYVQDVLAITGLFVDALNKPNGDLYQTKFVVFNQALANSGWVGGADFDCIIQQNGRAILTDIKTTTIELKIAHLRQLIGYVLLHDELLDGFGITDVGIYSARAGSFRYLPIEDLVKKCMPTFNSISEVKKYFRSEVRLN